MSSSSSSSSSNLSITWDAGYIIASYVIAVVGSLTSLQLMKRRTGVKGLTNWLYLLGGSISLGAVGIWCMHFVGMMSVTFKDEQGNVIDVGYESGMTVASLIIAIATLFVGFILAGDPNRPNNFRIIGTGVVGGLGVGAMHYLGMMAMVSRMSMAYDAGIIVGSIFVGIFAATAALFIFFRFKKLWQHRMWLQIVTAMIMGVAVCGMHYTGMQAIKYTTSDKEPPNLSGYADKKTLTIIIIILAVVTCVLLTILNLLNLRHMLLKEKKKSNYLVLSAIVRDQKGHVLTNFAGTLPSVIIEKQYNGSGQFNHLNSDFLRMLKTSFRWSFIDRYNSHLIKLHQDGIINDYSIYIYQKFIQACHSIATALQLSIQQLGIIYWLPLRNSMVLLVVRHRVNEQHKDRLLAIGYRFVPPAEVKFFLMDNNNNGKTNTNTKNGKNATTTPSAVSTNSKISPVSGAGNPSFGAGGANEIYTYAFNNILNSNHPATTTQTRPIKTQVDETSTSGYSETSQTSNRLSPHAFLASGGFNALANQGGINMNMNFASQYIYLLDDYIKKIHMPLTGDETHTYNDILNEFLREVAHELFIEKENIENEIVEWRSNLGKYVQTKQHLYYLTQYPGHWSGVKLDPMIKVQIERSFASLTNMDNLLLTGQTQKDAQAAAASTVGKSKRGRNAPGSAGAAAAGGTGTTVGEITLYVGLFYIQVSSGGGLRILLSSNGPYSMIPLAKFPRQYHITPKHLAFLKTFTSEMIPMSFNGVTNHHTNNNTVHNTPAHGPVAANNNTNNNNNNNNNNTLTTAGAGPLNNPLTNANATNSPLLGVGASPLQTSFKGNAAAHRKSEIEIPSRTQNGANTSPNHATGNTSNNGSIPLMQERAMSPGFRLRAATTNPVAHAIQQSFFVDPMMRLFHSDFLSTLSTLGKSLGTSKDLQPDHLYFDSIIPVTSDISILCFNVCNMSNVNFFPLDYNSANLFFLPLPVFDIIHFSLYPPKKQENNWTKKLLQSTLNKGNNGNGANGAYGSIGVGGGHGYGNVGGGGQTAGQTAQNGQMAAAAAAAAAATNVDLMDNLTNSRSHTSTHAVMTSSNHPTHNTHDQNDPVGSKVDSAWNANGEEIEAFGEEPEGQSPAASPALDPQNLQALIGPDSVLPGVPTSSPGPQSHRLGQGQKHSISSIRANSDRLTRVNSGHNLTNTTSVLPLLYGTGSGNSNRSSNNVFITPGGTNTSPAAAATTPATGTNKGLANNRLQANDIISPPTRYVSMSYAEYEDLVAQQKRLGVTVGPVAMPANHGTHSAHSLQASPRSTSAGAISTIPITSQNVLQTPTQQQQVPFEFQQPLISPMAGVQELQTLATYDQPRTSDSPPPVQADSLDTQTQSHTANPDGSAPVIALGPGSDINMTQSPLSSHAVYTAQSTSISGSERNSDSEQQVHAAAATTEPSQVDSLSSSNHHMPGQLN